MKNTTITALDLALALGRQVKREMRKIEERRGATDDEDGGNPFASCTRGKNDDVRRLRNLTGVLNDLGAAHKRFAAVAAAYAAACDELNDATSQACAIFGTDMKALAESLANVGDAPKSE